MWCEVQRDPYAWEDYLNGSGVNQPLERGREADTA